LGKNIAEFIMTKMSKNQAIVTPFLGKDIAVLDARS
jgi:hypothetical protein